MVESLFFISFLTMTMRMIKTLTDQPGDEHHDKREDKNYKTVKKDKK